MAGADVPDGEFDAVGLIVDQARRLLDEQATRERLRALLDTPGAFDADLWESAVQLGWPAAPLSEQLGGFDLGWQALFELCSVLGRYTASVPLIAASVTAHALRSHDEALARSIGAGERIASLDLGGPGPGSGEGLKVIDGYVHGALYGTAFAAVADLLLTIASSNEGLVLVAIDLAEDGVLRVSMPSIDNGRGAANISFDGAGCTVLGGDAEIEQARHLAALATAFEQIGGAERCLELSCDYARERRVFGQPIGAFQAVKHKLADFYCAIELAKGCAYAASGALKRDEENHKQVAAARLMATEAYEFASQETIQVFGGLGVTWEAAPHHFYRRSRALALEMGSPVQWRDMLVDDLVMEHRQ